MMGPHQIAYRDTLAAIESYRRLYNAPRWPLPAHVRAKLTSILRSPDPEGASRKARQTAEMAFLAAWARGRIPGRITEANAHQRAAGALSLADYLDSIGEPEAAQKQRQRAEKILRMAA